MSDARGAYQNDDAFKAWCLANDPDYEGALSQADGHALAQYSDRIPARAQHLPITEAPEEWIDQNHRNMVNVNTAETLQRFEVTPEQQVAAWWDRAIPLGRMLLAYAAFVLGALLVVWLATRGGR